MSIAPRAAAAIAPLATIVICAGAARLGGGDPLLGAELALAGIVGAWLVILVRRLRPALAGQRALQRASRPARLGSRNVRVVRSSTPHAFVLGAFRPTVFVSASLLETLEPDEVAAVLLHEEHHRRTRAPLRGLALTSWAELMGGVRPIGNWIERRLAHLEVEADRYAMASGVSAAAVASALVKCDRSAPLSATRFTASADVRLRSLVDGTSDSGVAAAPIEWLVPVIGAAALAACHLFPG